MNSKQYKLSYDPTKDIDEDDPLRQLAAASAITSSVGGVAA
ncbi:hypothetical protein [Rosistilla oblonga]|nr:hypothetical protein [Rosistilla oblonga]